MPSRSQVSKLLRKKKRNAGSNNDQEVFNKVREGNVLSDNYTEEGAPDMFYLPQKHDGWHLAERPNGNNGPEINEDALDPEWARHVFSGNFN